MSLLVRIYGLDDCIAAFKDLPRSVYNRHMRIALNAGGGVLRDAAKARVPRDSGLLAKSLKVKVTIPNQGFDKIQPGRPGRAIIGPSRKVVGVQTFRKSGLAGKIKAVRIKRKNKVDTFVSSGLSVATTLRRPSRYAHLVEKGTKRGVKATRFLASAVSVAGPAAQAKVIQKLQDGIHNWARNRAAKAGKQLIAF